MKSILELYDCGIETHIFLNNIYVHLYMFLFHTISNAYVNHIKL